MSARIFPKNVAVIGAELAVAWSDGTENFFPLAKLRQQCPCAVCQGEADVLGEVERPARQFSEDSFTLRQLQTVEAAHIQDQVKRPIQAGHPCRVPHSQVNLQAEGMCLALSLPDGTRHKIDTGCLPAMLGKRDDVRAGTTAQVEGASRRMALNESHQLRRADPGIPGRLAQVKPGEEQAA
jgi:hypothetical protein